MTRAYLTLGMHRSGTSFLAGSLSQAGVHFVDVPTFTEDNQHGSYENKETWEAHDTLIESNGGTWWNPPHKIYPTLGFEIFQTRFIASMDQYEYWGIKDPRLLLLLDIWLGELFDRQIETRLVGIFRHPSSTVKSLNKRNPELSIESVFQLWLFHNRRLLYWAYRYPGMPLFDYDDYRLAENISSWCKKEGLPNKPDFFDSSLRHNLIDTKMEIPDDVHFLYAKLIQRATL